MDDMDDTAPNSKCSYHLTFSLRVISFARHEVNFALLSDSGT